MDFAVDSAVVGRFERSVRAHAWVVADELPELRQVLRDRRTEMVAFSRFVLQEAVVRGELPAWLDADSIAAAFVSLVDGFVVQALEAGSLTAEDARREAYALLELVIGAPREVPQAVLDLRASPRPRIA